MNIHVGLYDAVTSEYVLAGAKRRLGLRDTTIEDSYLKDLINECVGIKLKGAGTRQQIITTLRIERVGGITPRAKLPSGFIRFTKEIPVVYCDAQGNSIMGIRSNETTVTFVTDNGSQLGSEVYPNAGAYGNYYAPMVTGNSFYKDNPFNDNILYSGAVNIVDGYLYFSEDVDADYVKIVYWGVKADDRGNLIIPAQAVIAVEAYACANWCQTNFTTHGAMIDRYERMYRINKKQAKAAYNLADSLEYNVINRIQNSLI
jgi:hypothetical protein